MSNLRETRLLELAAREVTPPHVDEFEPIARGLLFALAGMFCLGIVSCFYMAGRKLAGLVKH